MLGDQAHLFDRGWKSERMGLGIGAAAYYRRIVEIRWEALVKSLLEAATAVGAGEATVVQLRTALENGSSGNRVGDVGSC